MDSQDSTEVEWGSSRQPSISLKEWDIPIEDLKIGPKIGSGQFSTGTPDQTFIKVVHYISASLPIFNLHAFLPCSAPRKLAWGHCYQILGHGVYRG